MSFIICRQWVKLGKEFFHCMSVYSIQWDENIIHLLSLKTIQSTNHLPEKELEDLIDGGLRSWNMEINFLPNVERPSCLSVDIIFLMW